MFDTYGFIKTVVVLILAVVTVYFCVREIKTEKYMPHLVVCVVLIALTALETIITESIGY